ncbi:MAG: hypothetical protein HQK97_05195 [Nitrospirae bacterium]|nr:hypothetical protein [Nitrospirota bacterium]
MERNAKDSTSNTSNDNAGENSHYNKVDLDKLIKWTLLFTIVYFGASLLLK